jgi:hypothetical protein
MSGSRWHGRVVVHVGAATQRELHADLAALPSRARAERLRQLALLGLSWLRGGPAKAAAHPDAPTPADRLAPRRARLLQALDDEP